MLFHGIFAITLTLLILDLRVPEDGGHGQLWEHLRGLAPQAAAYVFGFTYLMAAWVSLREMFRVLRGVTLPFTVILLIGIGFVSMAPFTVSTLAGAVGDSDDMGVAVRLMAVLMGSGYLLSAWSVKVAVRQGFAPAIPYYTMGPVVTVAACIAPCVLAAAASYASPWLGVALLSVDILLGLSTAGDIARQARDLESVNAP